MEFSRYIELLRATAKQMIEASAGAPPLVQSLGPAVSVGLPAARRLLGETTQEDTLEPGWRALGEAGTAEPWKPARFYDTFGFSRPVYHPFMLHLFTRAGAEAPRALSDASIRPARAAVAGQVDHDADRMPLRLWWAVCATQHGERSQAADVVDGVLANRGPDGALHPRSLDDLLDAWTFRELAAMHALGWLTILHNREDWRQRLREAALHHQAHTQPDYTTYQPWGIFAFILAEVPMFAEQQLHDATTQVHVERGGAGTVPALILTDAVAALGAAG